MGTASKAAAMRAQFSAKESAPETQTGTIRMFLEETEHFNELDGCVLLKRMS